MHADNVDELAQMKWNQIHGVKMLIASLILQETHCRTERKQLQTRKLNQNRAGEMEVQRRAGSRSYLHEL